MANAPGFDKPVSGSQNSAQDELKHTQKKMWDNNQLFRAIFNRAGVGMAIVDSKGRFVESNSALQSMLGYDADELAGMVFTEVTHPDDVRQGWELGRELFAGKRTFYHVTRRYIRKNGHVLWGRLMVSVVQDDTGSPQFIIGMLEDITESKRVGSALRDSEERFRLFMDNSPTIAWIKDEQGRYVYISKAAEKRYNIDAKQVLGRTDADLLPESFEIPQTNDQFVLRAGHPIHFTEERIAPDGLYNCWLNSKFPFKNSDGKWFVAGIGLDITEQKRNEKALHASETRFRDLAEMLPEGVFETDTALNLTFTNQQAYTMFGYSKQDFEKGLNAFDMIAPEDRARAAENIGKVIRQSDLGLNEYCGLRKDGTVFPMLIRSSPVVSQGGVSGLRGIILDITERKRFEEKLQQVQRMESLGKLAGGIAHDFNNILTSVIGRSELLLGTLPPDSHEYQSAKEIFTAGKRGSDLVKQILAFSRQPEHETQVVRIEDALQETLMFARATIPANIEISSDIQCTCGWVVADPTQLQRIAINLITNAYDAVAPDSGKIAVSLIETEIRCGDAAFSSLKPGPYALLSISDNGCGIEPAILDKIFEPYFTTKAQGKGTGLGLAVVFGIVKAYQGDIQVHSELGKGTTFKVYLPLTQKEAERVPETESATCQTGKEKILLVDDEDQIACLEALMLEKLGYTVTSHTSSADALKTFQSDPYAFDLVITDMTMPEMTGDHLASEILSIRPEMPVIICTGYSDRFTGDKVSNLGVRGLLMKPFDLPMMARVVREVLDEAVKVD